MDSIVVLGSGTMAIGIAAGFIEAGVPVVLLGRSLARAQAALSASLATASRLSGLKPDAAAGHDAREINS